MVKPQNLKLSLNEHRVNLDEGTVGKALTSSASILSALQQTMLEQARDIDVSTGAKDSAVWLNRVNNACKIIDRVDDLATRQAGDKKPTKYKGFFNTLQHTRATLSDICTGLLKPAPDHTDNVRRQGHFLAHFTIAACDLRSVERKAPRGPSRKTRPPTQTT